MMKRLGWRLVWMVAMMWGALSAANSPKAMIIFDASGSMWGQIDGVNKIVIARDALKSVVQKWNPKVELGLTVYGHRVKGDCNDIQTILPIAKINKKQMIDTVFAIQPKGMTPIAKSLRQVANSLRQYEDQTTIILISDGRESCEEDPCATAKQLKAEGINFIAHVVGFNVDATTDKQLACVAKATGGEYFSAKNAVALNKAIRVIAKKVAKPKPKPKSKPVVLKNTTLELMARYQMSPKALNVSGMQWEVIQGNKALYSGSEENPKIPAKVGKVHIKATYNRTSEVQKVEGDITLKAKKSNPVTIQLKSGKVTIDTAEEQGGPKVKSSVHIYPILEGEPNLSDEIAWCVPTRSKACERILPIGDFLIKASYNGMKVQKQFVLGNKAKKVLHLYFKQTNKVYITASEKEGGKWIEAYHEIYKIEDGESGPQVTNCWSAKKKECIQQIPVGKYLMKSTYNEFKRTTPFEIKSGERTKLNIVFGQTNKVEITASETEGGKWIEAYHEIYKIEDGESGPQVSNCWSAKKKECIQQIPVGKYLMKSTYNEFKRTTPFEIKSGERTKLNIVFGQTNKVYIAASETEGGKWIETYHAIYKDDGEADEQVTNCWSSKKKECVQRLPVGKYILKSKYNEFKNETAFDIKAGKETRIHVLFAPFKITAKGLNKCSIVVFEIISPKGRVIESKSAPAFRGIEVVLPDGKYFVEATLDGVTKKGQFEIGKTDTLVLDFGGNDTDGKVEGVWKTTEGKALMHLSGTKVSGIYGSDNGELVGEMTYPQRFEGVWIEDHSSTKCSEAKNGRYYWGKAVWEFEDDMCSFKGKWGYCGKKTNHGWSGTFTKSLPKETSHEALIKADKQSMTQIPTESKVSKPATNSAIMTMGGKQIEIDGLSKKNAEDLQKAAQMLEMLGGLMGGEQTKAQKESKTKAKIKQIEENKNADKAFDEASQDLKMFTN